MTKLSAVAFALSVPCIGCLKDTASKCVEQHCFSYSRKIRCHPPMRATMNPGHSHQRDLNPDGITGICPDGDMTPDKQLEHDIDDDHRLNLEMVDSGEGNDGIVGGKYPGGGQGSNNDNSDEYAGDEPKSLPSDLLEALAAGAVSKDALSRYKKIVNGNNALMRMLITIPAFRTRVLADSAFVFKLLVQELIGNGTALASEFAVRGKDIVNEIEYVASDLIVGTVVEAAFVWLLAPRLAASSANGAVANSRLSRFLGSLPANAFEASSAIKKYTPQLRVASFICAGLQYAAIGMVAGVVGTAITYGLIESRKLLDPSYIPERPMPPILANSVGWAAFMAVSSNTRFQLVEGIEQYILPWIFRGSKLADVALKTSIIGLRFANNYYGGVQFIQFFRYLGLHAVDPASLAVGEDIHVETKQLARLCRVRYKMA